MSAMRVGTFLALTSAASATQLSHLPAIHRLRGGLSSEQLTQGLAGLTIASGAFAYISPKKDMEMYGSTAALTDDVVAYDRYLGACQILLGAVIQAGAGGDVGRACSVGFTGGAISLLLATPGFEKLGGPKEPLVAWIVALTALGKLLREGKIDTDLGYKISLAAYVLTGAQFWLAPDSAIEMYKVKATVGKLGKACFKQSGAIILTIAAYLYGLSTKGHDYGLALCSGLGAISTIKLAMTDAVECGIDQTGLYIWTAVLAAVGYYSYQNSL